MGAVGGTLDLSVRSYKRMQGTGDTSERSLSVCPIVLEFCEQFGWRIVCSATGTMFQALDDDLDRVTPEFRAAYALIIAHGDRAFDWHGFRKWVSEQLGTHANLTAPRAIFQPTSQGGAPVSVSLAAEEVDPEVLSGLIALARQEVLTTLVGLVKTPAKDEFVKAAIYRRQVVRQSSRGESRWAACGNARYPLSENLLALFTVDVLTHRDRYEGLFRVCRTCGTMAFDGVYPRDLCPMHEIRSRATTVKLRPSPPSDGSPA